MIKALSEHEFFQKMDAIETEQKRRGVPLIGKEKGKFIFEILKNKKPKKILELGTGEGYSGIILGSTGAELTTIDWNKNRIDKSKKNFAKFGMNVTLIEGDCIEKIKILNEKYDIIFMDFTKKNYKTILEDCIKLLKRDGIIIADNVKMIKTKKFHDMITGDKRFFTKIIEIGDGLSVSKLS